MLEELFYKDILTLLFANERNKQYFREHYNNSKYFQMMLRDYLKINIETTNLKIKKEHDNRGVNKNKRTEI